jgi:hypothetical protein
VTIVGISGKRESGKSTLGKFLEAYGYHRLSLASPLKEMCMRDFRLTREQVYGKQKEVPTGFRRTDGSWYTPRDILIRVGSLYRSIDKDFWCRKLDEEIMNSMENKYVIDDIRFTNEIEYFKKLGGKFVRLERSEEAIGKAALDDLSETELDGYQDWDAKLPAVSNLVPADLERFAEFIVTHVEGVHA